MSFANVQGFMANFDGGGARPNTYKVTLTYPAGIDQRAGLKFEFSCKGAAMPGSTMGIAPAAFMGRQVKFAGDRVFDDWNVQVYNDVDFITRDSLIKWSALMNGHTTNTSFPGFQRPENYLRDAFIEQHDREGRIIKRYRMTAMFPMQVGEIQLGWDANDQIEEFPVTFACNWWEEMTNASNTM